MLASAAEKMLKIVANVDKKDVVYSFSAGQAFPKVDGKLISVEVSGKELAHLLEHKEIPISCIDGANITWHGRAAGRALKEIKEALDIR